MSWLTLDVKHKCPYCNSINYLLKYYTPRDMSDFIEVNDYIPNSLDSDIGFVVADGYCEYCNRNYVVRVGVKKSRLTDIVIHEGDVNGK